MSSPVKQLQSNRTRVASAHVIAAVSLGAVLLAGVAIANGFALVWPDTGSYIAARNMPFRTPFYGYLIHLFHWRRNLWPVVVMQASLLAYVMWLTARCALPRLSAISFVAVIGVVSLLSSAPWVAGLLMPDLFAPILVLTIYLLGFRANALAHRERVFLWAVYYLSVVVHLSHPLLAVGLVAAAGLLCWAQQVDRKRCFAVLGRLSLPILLGLITMLANSYFAHGKLALSAQGAVIQMSRLIADGPARQVLRDRCPRRNWKLCSVIEELPDNSDVLLWSRDGPFARLGGFAGLNSEAEELIAETIRSYPGRVVSCALRNWALQLVRADTGWGLESYLDRAPAEDMRRIFPALWPDYADSLQGRGGDRTYIDIVRQVHRWPMLLAFGLTLMGVYTAWRRGKAAFYTLGLLILAGVVINALITGALSTPNPRYQSRVVWLPLFYSALFVTASLTGRSGLRSGEGEKEDDV